MTSAARKTNATRARTTNRTEEIEQARFVRWTHQTDVRELMPALRWLHHSPNGGRRDGLTGAQMKALGTKPGFPDLLLPVSAGLCRGLAIEMKSETGRCSAQQTEWIEHLAAQEWIVEVARSADDARAMVCRYLGIHPNDAPPLDR